MVSVGQGAVGHDPGLLAPAIASYLKRTTTRTGPRSFLRRKVPITTRSWFLTEHGRTHVKEAQLDTTLIYAYAKANKLGELEEFISAQRRAHRRRRKALLQRADVLGGQIAVPSINNNAKLTYVW